MPQEQCGERRLPIMQMDDFRRQGQALPQMRDGFRKKNETFRIVGITLKGVFALLSAILMLPARVLRGPRAI